MAVNSFPPQMLSAGENLCFLIQTPLLQPELLLYLYRGSPDFAYRNYIIFWLFLIKKENKDLTYIISYFRSSKLSRLCLAALNRIQMPPSPLTTHRSKRLPNQRCSHSKDGIYIVFSNALIHGFLISSIRAAEERRRLLRRQSCCRWILLRRGEGRFCSASAFQWHGWPEYNGFAAGFFSSCAELLPQFAFVLVYRICVQKATKSACANRPLSFSVSTKNLPEKKCKMTNFPGTTRFSIDGVYNLYYDEQTNWYIPVAHYGGLSPERRSAHHAGTRAL